MTVTCEECGKEYTGNLEKVQLNAHKRKHINSSKEDVSSARSRSESGAETLQEKVARLRKERKPIGSPEKKWSCHSNDGYHYRVFNDDWMTRPGNIQKAKEAGYEFVSSDNEKEKPQIVGTNDNGTPIRGYLMRIPKEIFDEDQAVKQKELDKIDKQIKTGKFQQGTNDNRYIPTTGIHITSDNRAPE